MKKALIAALSFVLVSCVLVNGTFALPDLSAVFQTVTELLEKGIPELGGAGTAVNVEIVSDDIPQQLFPGGTVSRTASVKNIGSGDVYFRLVYAIQYDEESWDHLTIDFDVGEGFQEHDWQDIAISDMPFKMKVFTYLSALPTEQSSADIKMSLTMGTAVTSEQIAHYRSDFVQMQALAIDPTPFNEKGYTTAEAALNLALPLDTLNPF